MTEDSNSNIPISKCLNFRTLKFANLNWLGFLNQPSTVYQIYYASSAIHDPKASLLHCGYLCKFIFLWIWLKKNGISIFNTFSCIMYIVLIFASSTFLKHLKTFQTFLNVKKSPKVKGTYCRINDFFSSRSNLATLFYLLGLIKLAHSTCTYHRCNLSHVRFQQNKGFAYHSDRISSKATSCVLSSSIDRLVLLVSSWFATAITTSIQFVHRVDRNGNKASLVDEI